MKKTLLSAAGAFALLAAAFTGSAHAQCMWTGFNWSCAAAAPVYADPFWSTYYYPYNTYPTLSYEPFGWKPQWAPSFPGPRPSSGAGW